VRIAKLVGPYCGRLAQFSLFSTSNVAIIQYQNPENFILTAVLQIEYQLIEKSIISFSEEISNLPTTSERGSLNIVVGTYIPQLLTRHYKTYKWLIRSYYLEVISILVFHNRKENVTTDKDISEISIYEGPTSLHQALCILKGATWHFTLGKDVTTSTFQAQLSHTKHHSLKRFQLE